MELLQQRLQTEKSAIIDLKQDLLKLNSMLENAAGFRANILRHIDTREVLIDKLDQSMPALKPISTKSLLNQNRGLSNDFLFRGIYQSIVDHNEDISRFQ